MTITANLVKELRERTGAGMMECKKALQEASGDIEAAIDAMRKAGQAKAAKKAGRIAAEGLVAAHVEGKQGSLVEINCETDFVARDSQFNAFVNNVVQTAAKISAKTLDALLQANLIQAAITVEQARQELIAKIGENIHVRRVAIVAATSIVSSYIHNNHRIGVIVALKGGDESLARDIAMHIAACNPIAISGKDVATDVIAKEEEIARAQAQTSGKPANIIEKMVTGRVNKFLNEVTLLGQAFVKDPTITIEKLLQQRQATVEQFVRFEVGEGIEKKKEDFVAEVLAQARGAV